MNNKRIKSLLYFIIVTMVMSLALPIYNVNAALDNKVISPLEQQLKELINKYGEENIIFEDGISLYENESLNLPNTYEGHLIKWSSIDSQIAKVSNDNILTGISTGPSFLLGEVNGMYIIQELYVYTKQQVQMMYRSAAVRAKDQYVVYVDAGHGGSDPGAVANGARESDLTLSISRKVKRYLEDNGVKVIMRRNDDSYMHFGEIALDANKTNADAFISIHINSFTSASANGIETYGYKSIDRELTTLIHNNVISNTGAYDRGAKFNSAFNVIKDTKMPASLLECGFITNTSEVSNLKSDLYQEAIAKASATGIMKYLEKNIPLDNTNSIPYERLYGKDRYETSRLIFDKGWTSSDNVVLVAGSNFPDALSSAPLAAKYNAPIILIENASISRQSDLLNLLKRKGVKNAFVVGGEGVLSKSIEGELTKNNITSKRLGGKDRFATSVAVAKEINSNIKDAVVVNGMNFADALSISSIAAQKQMPILLSDKDSLPGIIGQYIKDAKITKTFVAGGTGVVSNSVTSKLPNVERLGGNNRYETNKVIFNRFKSELNLGDIYLASALNFPDALSVSAVSSKNKSFVVLSHSTVAQTETKSIIDSNRYNINKVNITGSNVTISDDVLKSLRIMP